MGYVEKAITRSMFMSLPLHSMPILYLPRKVRLRFDLLQRDFLGEVVPWIILGT